MNDWKEAGKIAGTALAYGRDMIKPGASILEICQKVDAKILDLGGKPAFPCQISLNATAAHFCPDETSDVILSNEVVKLDCGAEFKGAIGDNAVTVDLSGENKNLVDASRAALKAAIATVKPGVAIREIGKAIQDEIVSRGFLPIVNLSGHGLDRYTIHTKPTIPNVDNGDPTILKEGMIFAIEPFATKGSGRVHEVGAPTIYSLVQKRSVRDSAERDLLKQMDLFEGKPFVNRWLRNSRREIALRSLLRQGVIHSYPPLVEVQNGLVSQAEHSVLVTADGCDVLTDIGVDYSK